MVLVPNRTEPCEWHCVFEPLAETRYSKRIHTLKISFNSYANLSGLKRQLALEDCQFFKSAPLQLTSLKWDDGLRVLLGPGIRHPFLFPPTLRSLTFRGLSGHDQFMGLSNLISFTFDCRGHSPEIDVGDFQTFLRNNQSLETLSLTQIGFKGKPNQDPVALLNLKFFSVYYPLEYFGRNYSTVFHVPALKHLSSFVFSTTKGGLLDTLALRATGGDILFALKCDLENIPLAWEDLTGYAKPVIQHVRQVLGREGGGESTLCSGADAQEILQNYLHVYL